MLNPLRILTALLVGILVIALLACGGDDDDGDEGGADETAAATTTGESDEETPEATEADEDEGDAPQDGDLDSYFTALEEILVTSDEEQEAIGNSLADVTADDPEYVTIAQEAFQESGALFEMSLLEISELDPPEEAAAAHDEYVTNLNEALVLLSELSTELDGATTPAEVDAAVDEYGPLISAENDQNEGLCLALQDIADENDVDVDLQCTT